MRLITDTNRIIAALIKDGASRKVILSNKFELVTAEFTRKELREHRVEILKKAKISEKDLDGLLALFFKRIYVVDDSALKVKFETAMKIMDKIDPDDTPFIALALYIDNDGIWSDDRHFKMQKVISVFTTSNLLKILSEG
ncbi:MAG: PIN domain-containing protein [Candidatus Marsarchaeota archaeon]|jgi:predicted nucleic acid-binding protein|nr:PIN domain-containing protein [Candidatus Marsarchaeota archaeon]MCL5111941.1 PIN domain-containing protein [Candidatus Marsarchaeota archaeon]